MRLAWFFNPKKKKNPPELEVHSNSYIFDIPTTTKEYTSYILREIHQILFSILHLFWWGPHLISIMDYVVATIKSLASGIIIMSDDSSSSQSTATTTATQKNALISIFALTGIYFLLSKVLSFVRLIFSLFIIPGKPVRPSLPSSFFSFSSKQLSKSPFFVFIPFFKIIIIIYPFLLN